MNVVRILENMAACKNYIESICIEGISSEDILGVGLFSSTPHENSTGVSIACIPSFLKEDIENGMVQGYISIFENESVFFQTNPSPLSDPPVFRWLMMGQHLSLFQSPKIDVLSNIFPKSYLNVRQASEYIRTFLGYIFSKIYHVKPGYIVILLDIPLMYSYMKLFFKWLSAHLEDSLLEVCVPQQGFEPQLISEILKFLSEQTSSHKEIIFVCQNPQVYDMVLNAAYTLKRRDASYYQDVHFSL